MFWNTAFILEMSIFASAVHILLILQFLNGISVNEHFMK